MLKNLRTLVSKSYLRMSYFASFINNIQSGRETSVIIVTDDYVIRNEKVLTIFLVLIFNELFKFKISDERQY